MRLILLFIFLTTFAAKATTTSDSLVNFNDLSFKSNIEKQLFDTTNNAIPYYHLKLALASGTSFPLNTFSTYISKFDAFIADLKYKGIESKKIDKRIKMIYEGVHNTFFKKYSLNCTFDMAFNNGYYNCVTATIFYALVLDYFKIPYVVKESTSHVFLIAMAENRSILLEATDPQKGYLIYNDNYKQQFVEYLKKQKIITNTEITEKGYNEVFSENYFSQNSIGLKQTIGLQYFNNAVQYINDDSLKSALDHLQRSHFLYPSERTKYLIFSCLVSLISKTDYTLSDSWQQYSLLTRFSGNLISNDQLTGEFERLTRKIIIEKSNYTLYDSIYKTIKPKISNNELLKSIGLIYNTEAGRYCAISNDFKCAFYHFENAFKLQPDNYQLQMLFIESLFKTIEDQPEDSVAFKLEKIYYAYEKLNCKDRIHAFLTLYYFGKAEMLYNSSNMDSADYYLNKFEKFYAGKESHYQMDYRIGEVYTIPASYYFKKNDKIKALNYINRGLVFAPTNNRLKKSLQMIKN